MIRFDNSYSRLPDQFFEAIAPAKSPDPKFIEFNHDLAERLGIDSNWVSGEGGLAVFSGNSPLEGAFPIAMAYAGHQFGNLVPQLGDGRAILLGELIAPDQKRFDVQLKGAGRTKFSRGGDGRAALGPVLREYIVSEFMASVGVPTTRALAALKTGETVYRETPLDGAILVRVAESHIRVGSFQYFALRQDHEALKFLADYVIDRHFKDEVEDYPGLLRAIAKRQSELIAKWMGLGFIHGVMNTDNMAISGETIDYGPCAFMDVFHPKTVFSSIDHQGRYAWGNQPNIAWWNLMRLAEALLPLLHEDQGEAIKIAEATLDPFGNWVSASYYKEFSEKLGVNYISQHHDFIDETLIEMTKSKKDFTIFFDLLTEAAQTGSLAEFEPFIKDFDDHSAWLKKWERLFTGNSEAMRAKNPHYIPRNHQIERVISEAYQGNFDPFHRLHSLLKTPFQRVESAEDYALPPRPEERVLQTFCGT